MKELVHLHCYIAKEDADTLESFCQYHGDKSHMIRAAISMYCKKLQELESKDTSEATTTEKLQLPFVQ